VRLMKKRIENPRLGKPLGINVNRGWWVAIEKYAQKVPGGGTLVDLVERDPVMAVLSSGHLTFVSCFGIWFWSTVDLSGECERQTKLFLFFNILITSPPLRIASIIMYAIGLIPFINIFFWGAIQLGVVYAITAVVSLISAARKRVMQPADRRPTPRQNNRRTVKQILSSVDRPILPSFIAVTFVMQVYFIIATELSIDANEALLKRDQASLNAEREWTFGQTLAVALTILPLRQVWKELRKKPNREAISNWFKNITSL
jgi:hypothetical protein